VLLRVDRVTYDEARDDLKQHFATTGEREKVESDRRFAHLDRFFAGRRLITISGADVTAYVAMRQGEGRERYREPGAGRARQALAPGLPTQQARPRAGVLLPQGSGARQGFFELDQFEAVRRLLAEDLRVVVTIAHTFGWRVPSEVRTLERRQLDLEAGTLRLDPGSTKNDDGRVVYLTPELKALLAGQVARVEALQRQLGRIIPCSFPISPLGASRRGARGATAMWASAASGCGRSGTPPATMRASRGGSRTTSSEPPCETSNATACRARSP
jgi:integrase